MRHIRPSIATACLAASSFLVTPRVEAQPVDISRCASGFYGRDIALRNGSPHDAFIPAGTVVKHVSSAAPGARPCAFGAFGPDIALGPGIGEAWGAALDHTGTLYVSAGSNGGAIHAILRIAPPYTGPPSVFFAGGANLRSLAIQGNNLYAADPEAGVVLRFDLKSKGSNPTVFARIPAAFGIYAAGVDDLYVTANAPGEIKHATKTGVTTVASGLSYPEGIGSDDEFLYIAAGSVLYVVPIGGGTPAFYANGSIFSTHGVTVWKGSGYTTDSHAPGEVHKFSLR